MCENCQVANQHFTDGQKDRSRPMDSSVTQGTSPDWGGRTLSSGVHDGSGENPDIPRFGAGKDND